MEGNLAEWDVTCEGAKAETYQETCGIHFSEDSVYQFRLIWN